MIRKSRLSASLVLFAFVVNLVAGTTFPIPQARAYDAPPKDQGHTGPDPRGSTPTNPDNCPCPPRRSPVNIRTGEFSYWQQDLFIAGRGLPLEVSRSYSSQDVYEGPFGYGWKFNLEIKLSVVSSGVQETVSIRTSDGVRLEFTRNDDGSYSAPSGWLEQLIKNGDGSYTWTRGPCSGACAAPRYQFNPSGYLVSISDRNSNQMSFSYDSSGRLMQVTDASGRKLTLSYGSNNKISTVTDPAGRTFTYGYDAGDNLVTYTDPAGNIITYGYDGAHRMTGITDARGNIVTIIKYDAQQRVTEYTDNGAKWTYSYDPTNNRTYKYLPNNSGYWAFTYDANGLVLSETDPLNYTDRYTYNNKQYQTGMTNATGAKFTFEYDDRGNRTGIIDPMGNKTVMAYHPTFNEVTAITDPLGRTTTFSYDDSGNLIQRTDPLGNKLTLSYNQYGQVTEKTDALGNTTKYGYDAYGNVNSITDALGKTATAVYDILGNRTKLIDARNNTTTYGYDVLGNMVSMTDALGNTTSYEFDNNSNLTKVVYPDGNAIGQEYDAYNRLTKLTDPLGNVIARNYDTLGRMTSQTDGNGYTSSYSYDLNSRLVKKTLPDGTEQSRTYDADGNILSLVDGKGNSVNYSYNALGRLKQISYPNGTKDLFTYDKAGRTVTSTDQKGNTTQYAYNDLGLVTTKTYADNTQETFGYDVLGRLVSADNANSQIRLSYDGLSRVTKAVQDGLTLEYSYDEVGNRTKLVYADGTNLIYAYDALGRLVKISDSNGAVFTSFSYDSLSRKSKLIYGNGTETTYQYDADGRMTSMTNKNTASGQVFASFTYGYDKSFSRTSMTDLTGTETYSLDNKYQVTKATYGDGKSTSYTYDNSYNRTATSADTVINYTINNMNQYTNLGLASLTYDQNGNITSDGSSTYSYDYTNRLIQISIKGNTITFSYDALGRLVTRSINNLITKYVQDGDRIVTEIGPTNQSTHYVFGKHLDEILGMLKSDVGTRYYCYLDGLGSVRNIAGSDGAVVESYRYDVFGKTTITDALGNVLGQSAIGNPNMYAGRLYDPDTGLYYYRARHYNPEMGRFLQMDPAGQFAGGLNLYAYVGNNPVNFVDPSGLGPLFVKGCILLLIVGGAVAKFVIQPVLEKPIDKFIDWWADRRLSNWAEEQQMRNTSAYGRYPPEAEDELKRVQELINTHYAQLKNLQCNAAAGAGYKFLIDQGGWNKLKFELVDYIKKGSTDINVIEIRLQSETMKDYVHIYLGPDGDNRFGMMPLYGSRSTYITGDPKTTRSERPGGVKAIKY